MSRIGKKPVELPKGVTAEIKGQTIEVKGPKGTRSFTATDDVDLVLEDGTVSVKPRGQSKIIRAFGSSCIDSASPSPCRRPASPSSPGALPTERNPSAFAFASSDLTCLPVPRTTSASNSPTGFARPSQWRTPVGN